MKRSMMCLFILCLLAVSILGCGARTESHRASSESIASSPSTPVFYSAAYDKKALKEMGITLTSTTIIPRIDQIEVRKIAEDLLLQSGAQPKGLYLEYGLINADVGVGAISTEAKDANPALKNKKSVSEIPVWVITMKGLLPDDYVPDGGGRKGKQPLDISSTVIDAMTGKVLFGFGRGK